MEEKKKVNKKNNGGKKTNNSVKKNINTKSVEESKNKKKVILEEVKEEVVIEDSKKEKEKKKIEIDKKENLKLEKIFCIIVAVIFGILLILSIFMYEFIPATLITLSLELFSIAYFISEKNEKDKRIYIFFGIGLVILFGAIIYTLSKIM